MRQLKLNRAVCADLCTKTIHHPPRPHQGPTAASATFERFARTRAPYWIWNRGPGSLCDPPPNYCYTRSPMAFRDEVLRRLAALTV